ncbi:hypothetical protein JYP46_01540 [Nitratireductor aquimarinus]|uniref:hypothetical protein n=1 Tax=Alphaproteobacteria TaxID=28211 RepID=UPI0019D33801|nr:MULTISPECIES: hypothetical protein [Alphaproteobacteria]MBN7755494.1 hypothetical protein [Nitratireductor aquimarinus]MBY5998249.1 hypothetical protein [Tritonibacter mobilis]MBY6020277.1 hypothetical protein [Nitratireductor sp. DP7N14-4]
MTPEQQKALALARARRRRQEAQGQGGQPQEQSGGGFLRDVDSFMRGAADMATFGLADEISAGLGALTGIGGDFGDYSGNLERQRQEQAMRDEADPISSTLGRVAGGVGSGLGLARGGLSLTTRLAPNAGLGARIGAGAAEGAAFGGAYGLGSGEGVSGRLQSGVKDAALGAAFGGAFPVVAKGASAGARAIMDSRVGREVAKRTGVNPEVLRMLGTSMQADDTLGPRGAANMRRAGSEAMLADAGPNSRSILDTAIQRGGPGGVQAQRAISERASRGARDLTAALDDTMGRPGQSMSREMVVYGDKTNPMSLIYKRAYDTPIDYSNPLAMRIEKAVKGRVPPSAIRAANELMRVEGNQSKQIMAKLADDGSVVFETLPDVRQLDYITRGLNEVAEQANGQGKLGGTTATGRAYANLSREIRNDLKELVPEYKTALDRAGTEIRKVKAEEFGTKLLSPSVTRDQVKEFVQDIPEAERGKLMQGVRQQIDDAMARVTRTVQDGDVDAREAVKALKDLSSRSNREKLAAAIGKEKADRLFSEVDRVATSFDLRASVAENSKTYARQATDRRIKDMTGPGPVGRLAQGEPVNATKRIVQLLTGKTPEKIQAREDAVYSQLANLLTRPQASAQRVFSGMNEMSRREIANALLADRINQNMNRASPALVYPTTGLLGGTSQR